MIFLDLENYLMLFLPQLLLLLNETLALLLFVDAMIRQTLNGY
jgi:hypothetical protein